MTKTRSPLTAALLVLVASLPLHRSPAAAVNLTNDDSVVPVPMDPTQSLTPIGAPEDPGPLIVGNVRRISCSDVGSSRYSNGKCPVEDQVRGPKVMNGGRIDFNAALVLPSGSYAKDRLIRPGEAKRITWKSCVGTRYLVTNLCGECMAAFEVTETTPVNIEVSNEMSELDCPGEQMMFGGEWAPLVTWANGLIPVGMVNMPGSNKIMGIAAVKYNRFNSPSSQPNNITQVEIYDPDTNTFSERDLEGHDMFCAGFSLLPNGHLVAVGGGQDTNAYRVSTFDPFSSSWSRRRDTELGHWYGTAVLTKDDQLLVALGIDKLDPGNWDRASNFPEVSDGLNFSSQWKNLSGVDLEGKGPDNTHFYPWLHLMPSGQILESGPQNEMFIITTGGNGSIESAGPRNTQRDEKESWGGMALMYEQGKVLIVGGIENWNGDDQPNMQVFKRAITVDMNDPSDIKTAPTDDMAFERTFATLVPLPTGEVLVLGGKNNTNQWDDTMSVYEAEVWNPETGKWTLLAPQEKPRNYHSSAILLKDARVLSGGGGLCGSCKGVTGLNQPNSQIYSPPYLFDEAGRLRGRPAIRKAPSRLRQGEVFTVVVNGFLANEIERFSLVRQSSVTHSLSTDARQLGLAVESATIRAYSTRYKVRALNNLHVMTPGFWFLFAVNSQGTPSVGHEIHVIRG